MMAITVSSSTSVKPRRPVNNLEESFRMDPSSIGSAKDAGVKVRHVILRGQRDRDPWPPQPATAEIAVGARGDNLVALGVPVFRRRPRLLDVRCDCGAGRATHRGIVSVFLL